MNEMYLMPDGDDDDNDDDDIIVDDDNPHGTPTTKD